MRNINRNLARCFLRNNIQCVPECIIDANVYLMYKLLTFRLKIHYSLEI